MRELKFRAWDTQRKLMVGVDYPDNWRTNNHEEWYDDDDRLALTGLSDLQEEKEVMQYTGLEDKNGVPIYESDLIEVNDRLCEVVWHEYTGSWDLEFKKHLKEPSYKMVDGVPMSKSTYLFRVIGNIHQNPELLNK